MNKTADSIVTKREPHNAANRQNGVNGNRIAIVALAAHAPKGLILSTYAYSHGGFSGKLTVTPSAVRDHARLESDPTSPILAISPR
jgi:hypothetical protein